MNGLDAATVAVAGTGIAVCLFFIVAYHVRTRGAWRRKPMGWYLMLGPVDLALILALVIGGRLFGDWPGRRLVGLVLFSFYVLKLPWLTALMWRVTSSNVEEASNVREDP